MELSNRVVLHTDFYLFFLFTNKFILLALHFKVPCHFATLSLLISNAMSITFACTVYVCV